MAKNFKFEIKGIKKTSAYLIAKNKEAIILKDSGLKTAGEFVKEEVKNSIQGKRAEPKSVDTGEFLNSVDTLQTNDNVNIFSNCEHAAALEYGTSRIKARRHFNNTKDRNEEKIKEIIKDKIQKV